MARWRALSIVRFSLSSPFNLEFCTPHLARGQIAGSTSMRKPSQTQTHSGHGADLQLNHLQRHICAADSGPTHAAAGVEENPEFGAGPETARGRVLPPPGACFRVLGLLLSLAPWWLLHIILL